MKFNDPLHLQIDQFVAIGLSVVNLHSCSSWARMSLLVRSVSLYSDSDGLKRPKTAWPDVLGDIKHGFAFAFAFGACCLINVCQNKGTGKVYMNVLSSIYTDCEHHMSEKIVIM